MSVTHPDQEMIALGIRQPWAELILRGIKTIEVRSQNTNLRGRIYIYASRKFCDMPAAQKAARKHGIDLDSLPRGVVVGTVELVDTRPSTVHDAADACVPKSYLKNQFVWQLQSPQPFVEPLKVRFLPYGIWFYPWKRRPKSL